MDGERITLFTRKPNDLLWRLLTQGGESKGKGEGENGNNDNNDKTTDYEDD